MKFIFVIASLFFLSNYSFSQRASTTAVPIKKTAQPISFEGSKEVTNAPSGVTDHAFEQYCLQNALQLITIPTGKESQYTVAGDLTPLENKQAPYKDYGIQLKENESQYFRLTGTNMLLKVESIYRLRLAYGALQH